MTTKFALGDIVDQLNVAANFARAISDCVTGMADYGCDDYGGLKELAEHHLGQLADLQKEAKAYCKAITDVVEQMQKQGPTAAPLSKSRTAAIARRNRRQAEAKPDGKPKLTVVASGEPPAA